MSVFRRRRREEALAEVDDDLDPVAEDAEFDDEAAAVEPPPGRSHGPWDVDDLPAEAPVVQRLDLGGLRVPMVEGTEVRVDVNPAGDVVAATVVAGASAVQLNAFAAPRSEGIWAEIRGEIKDSLSSSGGSAREVEGPFGAELLARVPAPAADGGTALQYARFLGIDGPRWFVRGLVSGPAATDPAAAVPLEQALRDVVVIRGTDAMAARDPLPLRLPKDVVESASAAAAQQQLQEEAVLGVPERGIETTETR